MVWIALALAACSPASGPQPNVTYFWQIKTSTLEFGDCSDAPDFRAGIEPLSGGPNAFIVYKVSSDKTKAVAQTCTQVNPASCQDAEAGVTYSIAGNELTFIEAQSTPVATSGCSLQETQTWTLSDQQTVMTLTITNVLTLSGPTEACNGVEQQLKSRSPNGLGVEGCVIQRTVTGALK